MKSEQLIKYFEGTASASEQEQILTHIRQSEENLNNFKKAKEDWKSSQHKAISLHTWQNWKQLEKKINPQYSFNRRTVISFVSIAASIALLFGIAMYTYSLHLNNQLVSIKSEAGQLTEVYLPDSTKVFINSSSSIVYKTNFFGLNREVVLEGEAFFDVTKMKYGSFNVIANKVKVHVTGTRFNVKAYPDENISVVLEEGRVELNHESKPSVKEYLKPGELMVFDASEGKFKRSKIKVTDYTTWKEGILYFENNKLPDLIKVLERRYGVQFAEISDPILKELTLTFTIRNEHLEKVMQLISAALPVKIETNDQIISINLDKIKYQKIH